MKNAVVGRGFYKAAERLKSVVSDDENATEQFCCQPENGSIPPGVAICAACLWSGRKQRTDNE